MNTFETLQSAVHELEEMVSAREDDIIERNVEIERLRVAIGKHRKARMAAGNPSRIDTDLWCSVAPPSEAVKGESDGKKDNQEVSGVQGNRDSVLSDASDVLPGVQDAFPPNAIRPQFTPPTEADRVIYEMNKDELERMAAELAEACRAAKAWEDVRRLRIPLKLIVDVSGTWRAEIWDRKNNVTPWYTDPISAVEAMVAKLEEKP